MPKRTEATKCHDAGGSQPGVISPDDLYTLDEFRARTKLGQAALRTLRRAGLRVIYQSGRAFIFGSDFIEFLISPSRSGTTGVV